MLTLRKVLAALNTLLLHSPPITDTGRLRTHRLLQMVRFRHAGHASFKTQHGKKKKKDMDSVAATAIIIVLMIITFILGVCFLFVSLQKCSKVHCSCSLVLHKRSATRRNFLPSRQSNALLSLSGQLEFKSLSAGGASDESARCNLSFLREQTSKLQTHYCTICTSTICSGWTSLRAVLPPSPVFLPRWRARCHAFVSQVVRVCVSRVTACVSSARLE